MIIHDHYDALLMSSTDAETATGRVIDLTEPGGVEHADLILSAPAAEGAVTLTVEGATEADGEFATVVSEQTEGGKVYEKRMRIPKDCPRFVRLVVSPAAVAVLRAAV